MVWKSRDDAVIVKWKDKRDVLNNSNAHVLELLECTNRHGKELIKPNLVIDYNNNMSGIDRADQMLSYHSSLRKTVRWYKKVGVHIIELFLINAHYIYSKYSGATKPLSITGFKEVVVEKLVGELKKKKHIPVKARFHYPEIIPPTEKKNNPARECTHCSRKNGNKRKETRYLCPVCPGQTAMCMAPCFRLHHQHQQQQLNESEIATDDVSSSEESSEDSSSENSPSDSEDDNE